MAKRTNNRKTLKKRMKKVGGGNPTFKLEENVFGYKTVLLTKSNGSTLRLIDGQQVSVKYSSLYDVGKQNTNISYNDILEYRFIHITINYITLHHNTKRSIQIKLENTPSNYHNFMDSIYSIFDYDEKNDMIKSQEVIDYIKNANNQNNVTSSTTSLPVTSNE